MEGSVVQSDELNTKGEQNMKTKLSIYVLAALALINGTQAQSRAENAVPVTPENFIRAETDRYFGKIAKNGSFGKFTHNREFGPIDKQNAIVRPQRDTLFSLGVFDLDAGPVTVILPNAGKHFMSMQVMDEDMYTPQVIYDAGSYTFTREQIDTRYVVLVVRILVDTANPDDVKRVHNLQDAIKVSQQSPGSFEVPNWDPASQKKVRDALMVLGATVPDTKRMFGTKDQVDPVRRLIGAASFWGGNPEKDGLYLNVTPSKNDGTTIYKLKVKDVPVDGFWSIAVYNAEGYFQSNELNVYSINNITAKKSEDGSVIIQFGGCDGKAANCLPILKGWIYTVRLYRPRAEILNGAWTFPEAQPVN
jgi:hypothetical protein